MMNPDLVGWRIISNVKKKIESVEDVKQKLPISSNVSLGMSNTPAFDPLSDNNDKIEILSVASLKQNPNLTQSLKNLAHMLQLEFGWHYLLDMIWIIENLGTINNQQIMDAGAGVGIIQWYLAQQGAEVISVDRLNRADLAMNFRSKFRIQGLRESDLIAKHRLLFKDLARESDSSFFHRWVTRFAMFFRDFLQSFSTPSDVGRITIYNQDLSNLEDIPSESLDAVVSVSALEHNTLHGLEQVVQEIMRVIKPNGKLLVTIAAAREEDWWHEPSQGWCLTEESIRKYFRIRPGACSNFDKYSELFEDLYHCEELRNNLASFYFKSDRNGMPWGKWDPKYMPVGILKIKRA